MTYAQFIHSYPIVLTWSKFSILIGLHELAREVMNSKIVFPKRQRLSFRVTVFMLSTVSFHKKVPKTVFIAESVQETRGLTLIADFEPHKSPQHPRYRKTY